MRNRTFVSAGPNCHAAQWLKKLNIQTDSYPFDWLLSESHVGLDYCLHQIRSRFSNFLNDLSLNERGHVVSSNHPKTEFFHHADLLSDDSHLREIEYSKLIRRANRLLQLLESNTEVTFLYSYHLSASTVTPLALQYFNKSISDFLHFTPNINLYIYFMNDNSVSDFKFNLQNPDLLKTRIILKYYYRNKSIHKTMGGCPQFFRTDFK
jgi:hypothetical protein